MSLKGTRPFTTGEHNATDWGVSKTKQSAEPECNINNIIALYKTTGQLTHLSAHLAQYRDVSGLPDLHEAMNLVADANSVFEELPAAVRKICDHDPANFLPFIDNPENFETCVALGLLSKSKEPEKIKPKAKSAPKAQEIAPKGEADGSVQGGE